MKIYLASPFFNEDETKVYNEVIELLRSEKDLKVFVPREHTIPNAWEMSNSAWGESVFAVDYLALMNSDVVVVLNFGMYSDSGTAWECGCAFALGKKVVNVLCGDADTEYSLMMVNGTNIVVTLEEFRVNLFEHILKWYEKEANEKISQK